MSHVRPLHINPIDDQAAPLNGDSTIYSVDGKATFGFVVHVCNEILKKAIGGKSEEIQLIPAENGGSLWFFCNKIWLREQIFDPQEIIPLEICVAIVQLLKNYTDHLNPKPQSSTHGQLNVEMNEQWFPFAIQFLPHASGVHVVLSPLNKS